MDCCNYMQYRHHQPYYGPSQYYDPVPYRSDFYGQQMYPEYYSGNSPYYSQQWPCTSSFQDYVYSPKEARIRKAMREATRDRSIGVSPMLPRPNVRRVPHSWGAPHEELMMSPLVGMRPSLESPLCNFSSLPSSGSNHFMPPMNSFNNKMEPTIPSTASIHSNYMQPNPLTQLQQHAEMWPDYQTMRPRTSSSTTNNPYMMPEVSSYHAEMLVDKQPQIATPPHSNENIPPDENNKNITSFENKNVMGDHSHPHIENNNEPFLSVFDPNDLNSRLDIDMKKSVNPHVPNINKKSSNKNKPLPDFNEAFGSTERGRFQSPPDPRLAPNKGYLDYFFDSNSIKFEDYQI